MNSVEFAKGGNIPKGHTKVLETEDFSYYSDENGEYIIMIRKSDGSVASDNYFAENDLYERMVEIANGREKYVYISPESKEYLKEYIEDYAKGGMIDTHLKQFKKRYKKDGVDVSKTYDKDRIQMISDDYNKLDLINNHEYMDMGYLDVYTDGTYILYSPRDFYEKGGKVFSRDEINENDLDTIFVEGTRYDGDMFSENQETTDIDYVIDNWKDNRNVATYKIYLRFNNGDEKELVEGYSYAKGGKIQINPNNHRYHILGYVKFSQKPELLATTNDKSEIKRIVNKIDFDKDKIFVTDDKEDRVVYNY